MLGQLNFIPSSEKKKETLSFSHISHQSDRIGCEVTIMPKQKLKLTIEAISVIHQTSTKGFR
uniref:Uncharacterized protein n=1 Tax=Utricularia reniformis TaxID=192314 RepID=A0A1Y0B1I3_9LAMI|nr:hypothetical protein AEK19_MT1084 [Utricularia reniformis]ART31306.1 hypothetical protein AEK19_MT1084 [Utricularia reniformis]